MDHEQYDPLQANVTGLFNIRTFMKYFIVWQNVLFDEMEQGFSEITRHSSVAFTQFSAFLQVIWPSVP